METANLSSVLVFLDAKSKEELTLKMFKINILNGRQFIFSPPIKDGNSWVTWYQSDIKRDKRIDQTILIEGIK